MKVFRTLFSSMTLAWYLPALVACASPVPLAETATAAPKPAAEGVSTHNPTSKSGAAEPLMTAPAATPLIIQDHAPLPAPVTGNDQFPFLGWPEVQQFMEVLGAKHGIPRAELESFFGSARFVDNAIQLMRPAPPGKPRNWQAYRARFVEPVRINAGVQFWDAHAQALAKAEAAFGVPAEIIVGIIGVETLYGRHTGRFRVPDVLTTLAFAYPDTRNREARMKYFRGEVENVLLLARENQVDPYTLLGSYAGAIGLPQFMPGSIRSFAVDFDGDGRIDLRNSPVDAIGSVANFLVRHGWRAGEPLAFPARVSADRHQWEHLLKQGLVATNTVDDLRRAGIIVTEDTPADFHYGLIDLQNGTDPTEHWIGTTNFFAITHYNRSYFYAMAVVDLGKAIKNARNRAGTVSERPSDVPLTGKGHN